MRRLLALALGLMVIGGAVASAIQTDFGKVRIEDVRFLGPGGIGQNGRLYIPKGATSENPAPGILAIHGYINSHETQAGFAIEFARRGFVVLAVDQTGHGFSGPPSGANGFGGPPALGYLRTLDIVDKDNIGLEGHSMGGWAVLAAAAAMPQGYRSIVLEGSSVPPAATGPDSPPALRNVAVVFSLYDEFSRTMWGVPVPREIIATDRLKAFFGTDQNVVPGRIYGSVQGGDARVLYQPPVTHPGDHLSRTAIGNAVEWFQETLDGGNGLPSSRQIWYWRELGTLVALVGMVLLLLAVGGFLLEVPWFSELAEDPPSPQPARGVGWIAAVLIFVGLPVLTFFPFKDLASALGLAPSWVFPQGITNQVMTWTTLVGFISLILFTTWHLVSNRRRGATGDSYGLTWKGKLSLRKLGKSFALALLVVLVGQLAVRMSAFFFQADFRFWVFAVRPLSRMQTRILLSYLLPFIGFFLVLTTLLHGQLRRPGQTMAREMVTNVALLTVGFAALLVLQYIPLFAGGTLAIPSEPLWTIIAFQFLPIMTVVGVASTFFYHRTGHVYVGAFVSGLLVTWIVVASQATHYAL